MSAVTVKPRKGKARVKPSKQGTVVAKAQVKPSKKGTIVLVEDLIAAAQRSKIEDTKMVDTLRERILTLEKEAQNITFTLSVGKYLMLGIIVVFFIAFLGFVLDAWKLHTNTYKEYQQTIESLRVNNSGQDIELSVPEDIKSGI